MSQDFRNCRLENVLIETAIPYKHIYENLMYGSEFIDLKYITSFTSFSSGSKRKDAYTKEPIWLNRLPAVQGNK